MPSNGLKRRKVTNSPTQPANPLPNSSKSGESVARYVERRFLPECAREKWNAVTVAAHVASKGGLLRVLSGQPRIQAWRSEYLLACSLPGPTSDAPAELRPILENVNPDYRRNRAVAVVNAQDVCHMTEENGRIPVTVAGLLLFGITPHRFLPQTGIDATAYPGREKDYAATERQSMRGAMTRLVQLDPVDQNKEVVMENGLVEQAIEFVRRNAGTTSRLHSGVRVDVRSYPEEAVREAIVNALVHRDYLLSGTTIELSIYADRLEIISPGRLPNGITPTRMRLGCRAARNQLVKDVMRDYNYLEHTGMGVPRKIVKGMLEHNGTEPDLIEEDERFTVRLWK
jgi:hypothetical protein